MARGTPRRFANFGRGLNTYDNVFNLADGSGKSGAEARDLLNVVSRSRGNVGKRDGCTTVIARSGVKDFNVVDSDTSALAIYSTTAGKLYALDEADTETELATGLSTSAPWTFLHLPTIGGQGPYLGMNGTDTPRYVAADLSTGSWTASSGTLPNGTMMCYAGNRVWVADGDTVYWSEIGDPRTWPAENVTRFAPGDGIDIAGLVAFGNYVLVFKERDIWVIYNLDTSANRRLTDEVGTLSPRAIVPTDAGCFFLDPKRGVLVTDGQQVKEVGSQILPTFQRISSGDAASVTAAYWNGHVYFAARLDGTTRYLLDYHVELGSWWLHSHQVRALGVWDRGLGPQLIAAHPDTIARLFVPGESLDEDVVFRSYWSGPFHDFGSSLQKRCREVRLDGSGTADVLVLSDFNAGQGTLEDTLALTGTDSGLFGGDGDFGGDGTFGGGVTIGQDSLYSLGLGRVWSVTVGNETPDPWELDAYTMFMTGRKD
ncbi:MAG TPA: hypothetical protein VFT50_09375 [Baekduia sp.]|nr:hypothetical protein [Baekduia sp.]